MISLVVCTQPFVIEIVGCVIHVCFLIMIHDHETVEKKMKSNFMMMKIFSLKNESIEYERKPCFDVYVCIRNDSMTSFSFTVIYSCHSDINRSYG